LPCGWRRGAVLLGGLLLGVVAAGAERVEGESVRRVREFLETPPRYESLLLRRTLSTASLAFRSRREAERFAGRVQSGALAMPRSTNLYEIRFQADPPAFLLRGLSDETEYQRPGPLRVLPLAGRYGSNWWSIIDGPVGQVQLLNSSDGTHAAPGAVTNRYHAGNERWATEFLRLGLLEVLPATLRWQAGSGRFVAGAEAGGEREGEVRAGAGPLEDILLLHPAKGGFGRRIRVVWTNGPAAVVPIRLEVDHWAATAGPDSGHRYGTYEVLGCALAASPLPREWFSPEPFLRTNDLWVEVEAGSHYVLHARGTNLVRELAPVQEAGWDLRRLGRIVFVVVLGTATLLLALAYLSEWRSRRRAASFLSEQP